MDSPRVSVVMLNYNGVRYIEDALNSVMKQVFADFELLVVDGGSNDGSLECVRRSMSRDSRVSLLVQKSKGVANAENQGINSARGEYVATLHSDDIYHPEKIMRQVSFLDSHPDFGACHTGGWLMDATGIRIGRCYPMGIPPCENGRIFRSLLREDFIINGSVVMRRKALGDLRFDPSVRFAEDWDFYLRLAKRVRFGYIKKELYGIRIHQGTNSSPSFVVKNVTRIPFYGVMLMKKWLRDFPDMDLRDKLNLVIMAITAAPNRYRVGGLTRMIAEFRAMTKE